MKLIIDIPEKVVTAIQNGEDYRYDIHTAIAQGIPYEERPQGEWIYDSEFLMFGSPYGSYKCKNCGMHTDDKEDNFCWHCGADMRGGNKE